MAKIPIDIVIILPEDIQERAIELNKELIKENDNIVLNKENCFPHISLAMAYIEEDDLPKIMEILNEISKEILPLDLTIIDAYEVEGNYPFTGLGIEKTEKLQELHEKITNKLSGFLKYDGEGGLLGKPEGFSIPYINGFKEDASFEKFFPHITLGHGKKRQIEGQIKFTASKISVCQLGEYCTCKKILGQV